MRPRAFAYSGFHHAMVRARLRVVSHDDDELSTHLQVETDDVVRNDEAATRTIISGRLSLTRGDRDTFWHARTLADVAFERL